MAEKNAKNEVMEIPVRITVEELIRWANTNNNLKTILISERLETKIQEMYQEIQLRFKKSEMNEFVIGFTFENYSKIIRRNLTCKFVSNYFRDLLLEKNLEDTENATILNCEWLDKCVKSITDEMWHELEKSFLNLKLDKELMGLFDYGVEIFNGNNKESRKD